MQGLVANILAIGRFITFKINRDVLGFFWQVFIDAVVANI
jgi:hypothetical protein